MNILKDRPNLLFLIWVRNQNKNFLVVSKLRRSLYLVKMIKALTLIKVYAKNCDVGGIRVLAGSQYYYLNGKLHRVDGPAIIHPNGFQYYYLNGKRHRVNGPAVIWPDGTEEYYLNGKRHRVNGPAVIWPDGTEEYYLNGKKVDPF
jgi:hypothetical protein